MPFLALYTSFLWSLVPTNQGVGILIPSSGGGNNKAQGDQGTRPRSPLASGRLAASASEPMSFDSQSFLAAPPPSPATPGAHAAQVSSNEPINRTETDSQTWRTDVWSPRVERGKEWDWECGVRRCKLWHLAWISNEVLLSSTRELYATSCDRTWRKIIWEKECIHYVYGWVILVCSRNWQNIVNQL